MHVLTQAPVQGKSAIARIHQDLLSPSFPTDPARIATFLRTKYLEQANSALLENLAKSFLAAPFGQDHEMYTGKQRLLAAALKAVSEFNPGTFEPVASDYCARRFSNVSDELLLRLCSYLDALPPIWSWLPESDRIRIQELLQKVDEEVLKDNHAFDALAVPEVQKTLRSRFSGLKTASKIDVIAEHPRREFKDDAIELFGDSWSFAEAQIWGEKLILPASRFLDADDVRTILLKAEHNDQIRSSPGMPDVLARLFDATRDLLPHTRAHWQAFVDSMTKQNKDDQTARYSYPKIRSLLESVDAR